MRPTYAQIGLLLSLQAGAGLCSTIPETEEEAGNLIEEIEVMQKYRGVWRLDANAIRRNIEKRRGHDHQL